MKSGITLCGFLVLLVYSCSAFALSTSTYYEVWRNTVNSSSSASRIANNVGGAELLSARAPAPTPTWPSSAEAMEDFLGFKGTRIPDGPATPGRGKVTWNPSENVEITLEQHPYDIGAPQYHTDPHWHLSTPSANHVTYQPGEPIPGYP